MDLNHQYAAHQRAVMRASAASPGIARNAQLWLASTLASDIGQFQSRLGAAAACAWIAASMRAASPGRPA
jgi:hypothetical protein